jgi:ferric-dicitrate binding protein FerR (iron transport regulator)
MSKSDPSSLPAPAAPSAVNRRTVFAGAGALGALGAMAAVVGVSRSVAPAAAPTQTAEAQAGDSGGYQLTDHVKQYYATARL